DSAFDLLEDGPRVNDDDPARVRALLEEEGLTVAQSSVHINAWLGDFDKATMSERLCAHHGVPLDDGAVYVGDSVNDATMFARVPLSVGVANLRGATPRYLTRGAGGHGFAEVVAAVLAASRPLKNASYRH